MTEKKERKNFIVRAALTCAALLLLLLLAAAPGRCGANLEEKTRYEKAQEQKVEEVLLNLLGPGKAKVMIQAAIDFSAKESVSSEGGGAGAFKWRNINRASAAPKAELLPGFPVESKFNPAAGEAENFQREISYPQAMIKRLTVSLVLSEDISTEETNKVRRVVQDLLAMDPARGDEILLVRARFAPVWYTAEMQASLIKYAILAVFALLGLGLAAGFYLKMPRFAPKVVAPEQPRKLSFSAAEENLAAAPEHEPLPEPAALPAPEEPEPLRAAPRIEPPPAEAPAERPLFNVPPEKLGILVRMLAKDEPEDIALIAVHLPAGLRGRFVAAFPPEKGAEVVAAIAKVRFVAPELIANIKEELERRLSGAVGGYDKAMEIFGSADMKTKKALFENLEKKHPGLAAQVRTGVIFLEDLVKLPGHELSLLAGMVPVEQWALAAWELPVSARPALQAQMTETSWQMVEQTLHYSRPPEEKIAQAVDTVIAAAWGLIGQSRISNPNVERPAAAAGAAPQGENKAPEGENKAPEGENKATPVGNKPPEGKNKAPEGGNKATQVESKPPQGENKPVDLTSPAAPTAQGGPAIAAAAVPAPAAAVKPAGPAAAPQVKAAGETPKAPESKGPEGA